MAGYVTVELSGRIHRDEETGYYVSIIDALDIATNAPTLEQVVEMTFDAIRSHFEVARKLGVLDRELGKLGIRSAPPIRIKPRLSVETEDREITLS